MAGTSKQRAKISAFKTINMVTDDDINNSVEYQDIIENALPRLWKFSGYFPGESDALREERLEFEGPKTDDAYEMAEHFRQLYPDIKQRGWSVIYTVYNRMKDLLDGNAEADESAVPETDSSEIDNNNLKKEDIKMAATAEENKMVTEDSTLKGSEDLANVLAESQAKLAQSLGGGFQQNQTLMGGSMPNENAQVDEITRDIVIANQQKEKAEKLAYSQNAKVTKVLLGRPNAMVRCVSDVGVIKDPQQAYKKFAEHFGVVVAQDGSVTFTNVVPGDEENAHQMYDALRKAINAGEQGDQPEFKIRKGDSLGSIRLVKLVTPEGGEGSWVDLTEFKKILVNKSVGAINVAGSNVQFKAGKPVERRNGKKTSGEGLSRNNQTKKKNGYDGLMTLKVAGRSELQENPALVAYRKELDPSAKTEMSDGVKSEMVAKYKKAQQTVDGKVQTASWRIPMKTEQRVLVDINDEEVKAKLPDGGIGRKEVAIDLQDESALAEMMNTLANIQAAAAAATDREGDPELDKIRAERKAYDEQSAAKQADEFAGAGV